MESGGRDPLHPPISGEEEALKRNTDCVYFLASPLTCKKGNSCEYRHSDGARVNPTDCWFWLNGNCLNAKCSFRHPPLEGFLDGQTATASGSTQSTDTKKSTKQTIPCYYFQNGWCLKGSRCSFMHGSQPSIFPSKSALVITPPRQNRPEVVTDKGFDFVDPSNKVIGFAVKTPKPLSPLIHQASDSPSNPSDLPNGLNGWKPRLIDQKMENGREGDDSLRESSPGFDVLVEEHEDAGYFQDDEGMNMVNSVDFQDNVDFHDDVKYEFERYGQHSEYLEERKLDASDLRCKLLMQRKADRPRSAIVAHPRHNDGGDNDDIQDHGSRSQSQCLLPCESLFTGRLRGRVMFPRISDTDNHEIVRSEEGDRRRGRSSSLNLHTGCHKWKASKRDSRGEEEEAGALNFVGPKSLAELKGRKSEEVDPLVERPKLMSTVLKRKREEVGEGSGQGEREMVLDLRNLENGAHEVDDDEDDDDDDDDDDDAFSRKLGVMFT